MRARVRVLVRVHARMCACVCVCVCMGIAACVCACVHVYSPETFGVRRATCYEANTTFAFHIGTFRIQFHVMHSKYRMSLV